MVSGTSDIPGASLGVFDGVGFAFVQESNGLTWWESAKALWKWGLAPIRCTALRKTTVDRFDKMYDEPQFPFASLTQVVTDVDLLDATSATGEQYISENGLTGSFGHDVIQASTRVNYAQNVRIHCSILDAFSAQSLPNAQLRHINGLLAMVCMSTDGAKAVENGNWQIFDEMIAKANATTRLSTEVSSVTQGKDGTYLLRHGPSTDLSDLADHEASAFDVVVLAAPHQFANITLDHHIAHIPEKISYVQLHVTLLTSPYLLSPAFFNMPPGKPAPKTILTTLPPDEEPQKGAAGVGKPGFFSVSLLRPVTNPKTGGQEYLYKIFSPVPPTSTFLTHLLGLKQPHHHMETGISEEDISWIYRKVCDSYPYEVPRVTFEEIQLDENLYYTSAMDGFISTMETNALMGMNVARLIADRWQAKMARGAARGGREAPMLLPSEGVM
ncbi:hypothetical protein B0A54_05452 [Friedmanniomyces endolithicus]|uniref:Prenylcysteine lyase domain-containing protein n=1 Tax=Friedmanniomyces endolithicus TaxID=329885 RepID=A0A4V6WK86_9PEZI|nr:hypothetical protein B0A54_05452 [Friedmanniomyces endolithicus]